LTATVTSAASTAPALQMEVTTPATVAMAGSAPRAINGGLALLEARKKAKVSYSSMVIIDELDKSRKARKYH
jgi:hypothetical protein